MNGHIEELAELYALGSLEEADRATVEQHTARCEVCAQRLDAAQEGVAQIAAGQPAFEPSPRLQRRLRTTLAERRPHMHWWSAGLAAAATLLLALIPVWLAIDTSRHATLAMRQDEKALARIAAAHAFNRATFMTPRKRPMDAQVLYGPHGDWYYVVVMHPRSGMHVAYVHGGRMEMLGTVAMHGESGTLYLPVNHKMEELALVEDGAIVAAAHLAY